MGKSVIAKGKRGKASVFSGRKQKTVSGLTKDKLMKNKAGKVVSKKASAAAKARYVKNGLKAWADAVKKARKELNSRASSPSGASPRPARLSTPRPSPCSEALLVNRTLLVVLTSWHHFCDVARRGSHEARRPRLARAEMVVHASIKASSLGQVVANMRENMA